MGKKRKKKVSAAPERKRLAESEIVSVSEEKKGESEVGLAELQAALFAVESRHQNEDESFIAQLQDVRDESGYRLARTGGRGGGLARSGRHEEALEWFDGMKGKTAFDFVFLDHMRRSYAALGNTEQAALRLAESKRIRPDNFPYKLSAFDSEVDENPRYSFRDIVVSAERKVEAITLYNQGVDFKRSGNLTAAKDCYERALEFDPHYAHAHCNLGNVYSELGEYRNARLALDKALNLDPRDAQVHNALGNMCFNLKDYQSAKAHFEKALSLDSQFPGAHSNLGNVNIKLKDYCNAELNFRQSLLLNDNQAEAHYGLANMYLERKEYKLAVESYNEALKQNSSLAVAHNGLGHAYKHLKQFEPARKSYEEAIKYDSSLTAAYLGLASVSQSLLKPNNAPGASTVEAGRSEVQTGQRPEDSKKQDSVQTRPMSIWKKTPQTPNKTTEPPPEQDESDALYGSSLSQ